MKLLLSHLIFICCFSLLLISCGSNNTSTQNNSSQNNSISSDNIQNNMPQQSKPEPEPEPEPEPKPEPTAYEQLNDNEKKIFDALLINFDTFLDPASVRITKILTGLESEWDTCGDTIPMENTTDLSSKFGISITLKITANNNGGGKSNGYYSLRLTYARFEEYEHKVGDINELSDYVLPIYLEKPEFLYASPAKINKAIVEYCEEMSLI